jgi:hypothetical protein
MREGESELEGNSVVLSMPPLKALDTHRHVSPDGSVTVSALRSGDRGLPLDYDGARSADVDSIAARVDAIPEAGQSPLSPLSNYFGKAENGPTAAQNIPPSGVHLLMQP